MTRLAAIALFALGTAIEAAGAPSDTPTEANFRVRADFAAPLNSDSGWAGALNENVTVLADQPFRIRFEAERAGAASSPAPLELQYRRNAGDWTVVDAHDFPYPLRELEVDFAEVEAGSVPEGWRAAAGAPTGMQVTADGADGKFLRVQAGEEPLVALFAPPWELDQFAFAAEYRLSAADAMGLVFGYVDANNYWRVALDAGSRQIRVVRVAGGTERVVSEQPADIAAGEWLTTEVQFEEGALEVNFNDDAVEFEVPVDDPVPAADFGVFVPVGSSAAYRKFVIEGEPSSPRVSIVSTVAYRHGEPTDDLLRGAPSRFAGGAGISMSRRTPAIAEAEGHAEFEWPLVIRRFADGAAMNEAGDQFEFRMVDERGRPAGDGKDPLLTLAVPPGHLGGTFVETPGRIGPWQAANGDLYFIMEPAESDNLFMMVKSTDSGRSWREVDGANRPETGDLESVDGRIVEGTIHILHQVSESTRYHAFRTSDHPTHPDTWAITDELATEVEALAQMASVVVRPDGSIVAFHVGNTIGYSVRSPAGDWSAETVITDVAGALAGPQAVLGANAEIHLAYYRVDGTIWYRRLLPGGSLTPPRQLASGAGTSEDDWGAVLPLVYIPETDTVVIIYRLADGLLRERRVTGGGMLTAAVPVSNRRVVQNAVDSQQAGADAVADGEVVHVLFIDDADRSIYSTRFEGEWQPPKLRVANIDGAWVRGNIYVRPDGVKVYGYAYDAGSGGGAGMNRFAEIELD